MGQVFEELQAALHSVWQRRWVVLGVAWGVCLLGWLAVALVPNSYESEARLFVQLDDALAEQIGIGEGDRRRNIERVRQTLTSAVNLEKVVRSTRLGEDVTSPAQMEAAVLDLAKRVEVVSEEENLFEITASSGKGSLSDAQNAALAQETVQKLIDIFREENLSGNRGEMRDNIAFLDQQLEERQAELEAAEARRMVFEANNPELVGGSEAIASKLAASRAEMRSTEADLAAAEGALAAIDGQLAGTPATITVPGSPAAGNVGGARAALAQGEQMLSSMRARGLTESHPDVIAQKRQVEALRSQAEREPLPRGTRDIEQPNPAYSTLESIRAERAASVQALRAKSAALQSEVTAFAANQSAEPAVAAEAERISRDYNVLREKYDELLENREALRLRGDVKTQGNAIQFEVIDPPTTPRSPAAPNRPILLLGVLLLGVGAGCATGFALGQLRNTFATSGKLERAMDLPVIGTISQTVNDAARAVRAKRMRLFYLGCLGLVGIFAMLMTLEFVQRGMVA